MAIGPVQLIVLGFSSPDFHGEVIKELKKLRESDTVRVIDSLAVYKDAEGEMEVMHLSNLSKEEAIEFGSKVAALIGLGIEGDKGFATGAAAGAEEMADGVQLFSDEEAWDVLEEIPNDSAAALILLEAPLGGTAPRRDRAGGRLPRRRRVYQPARPGRDRVANRRGSEGARGAREDPSARIGTARHNPKEASDVRSTQSRTAHVPARRPSPLGT